MKKKKNSPQRQADAPHLIVISDLHFGSSVALCPPEYELDDGGLHRFSLSQAWIWKRWNQFWGEWVPRVTDGEPFVLVINGDLLAGEPHGSKTLWDNNLSIQAGAAVVTLEPIIEMARDAIIVRGTEAHAGKSAEHEEELARTLKAMRNPQQKDKRSFWEVWVELGGYFIHFAHHTGCTSSTAYESSALNRELVAAFTEAGQWGEHYPDMIVRSHRHRHIEVAIPTERGQARAVVTPGWELKTPYVYRIDSMRLPQIGGLCISATPSGLECRSITWAPKRGAPVKLTL